ncbi:MAG TPA: nicotinate (nicotinamide) nucleotide adenylyltransferase [Alloacidobacterium sp.]|nr:nicotinate (nicotinamide) nucleotide adenylyltransferase [Alloacidobacterium sp.]
MRIAFFGGTFDPPHLGHLAIGRAAADRLSLDRVLFAPVGSQPLKQDASTASFADRVAMVKLAIREDARFAFSEIDAPRADGKANYTVDTISQLKSELGAQDHLFCLVGADSFQSLPHWYRAAELLFACDFIVAGRPGFSLEQAEYILSPLACAFAEPARRAGVDSIYLRNHAGQNTTLYLLPDLHEDISATAVRAALAGPAPNYEALPMPVAEYIRRHHLYR